MDFKKVKLMLRFSRQQRDGIFILFTIIALMQFLIMYYSFSSSPKQNSNEDKWLRVQAEIDKAKSESAKFRNKDYQFNPNFLTDYRAYKMGMKVDEIDRLFNFRKKNKFVNSAKEFQSVTGISDSLLNSMAHLFKFPNFKKNQITQYQHKDGRKQEVFKYINHKPIQKIDVNKASQDQFKAVYGIGEKLSVRIIQEREKFGSFLSMDQFNYIYGLSEEVKIEINKNFSLSDDTKVKKIAINEASIKELTAFPYFNYQLAKNIVTYRSMNGNFNNMSDLKVIKDFPLEKAHIIDLYLIY